MPSCRYRFRAFAAILIVFAATVTTGCKSDGIVNSTPEAAYEAYRQAMHERAWDRVFHLLKPDLQQKITATLDMNRQTIRLIQDNVPADLRANYLDSIGPQAQRDAQTPVDYFTATLAQPGRASDSIGSTVSTRRIGIYESQKGSNKWIVRTLGGERINVHGDTDGLYYIVPDEADSDRINQELKNAGDRLVIQQHIAAALARPPAPVPAPEPAPDAQP